MIWNAIAGKQTLTLRGHSGWVTSLAFSPDGKRIVSGSRDKVIKIWDTLNGRDLRSLRGHTNTVNSVAFSPDGKMIASGSSDKTIKVWSSSTGEVILTLEGHTDSVNSIALLFRSGMFKRARKSKHSMNRVLSVV